MKLRNGWLHKKSYKKAILWSSLALLAGIGFCCYEVFGRQASTMMVVMFAILFFLIASMVFTSFYSKDVREFSTQVQNVYMSMDPEPYYNFIESLDFSVLNDETVTKIAFFTAWFKHFEGKNEEAKQLFYEKAVKPFPYTNMLSLKCLIEIYLLDDKNEGYTVVKNTLLELNDVKVNARMKQQLENEIKGQILRLDAITRGEASEEIINSLKQSVAPFEYVQNQCFLAYLLKDKDPKTAYEAKDYVLKNYGKFDEYRILAEKIEIDFDPVKWALEHPEVEETEESETPSLTNEETNEVIEESVNETSEEVTPEVIENEEEPVKEDKE